MIQFDYIIFFKWVETINQYCDAGRSKSKMPQSLSMLNYNDRTEQWWYMTFTYGQSNLVDFKYPNFIYVVVCPVSIYCLVFISWCHFIWMKLPLIHRTISDPTWGFALYMKLVLSEETISSPFGWLSCTSVIQCFNICCCRNVGA